MSTSLVMMDTVAHRRTTTSTVNTTKLEVKPSQLPPPLVSTNNPINFKMKLLANSNQGSVSVARMQQQQQQSHHHQQQLHHTPVTAASTPQVQIKLEPRVPSPCTADLVMSGDTGLDQKDLSFYLNKSKRMQGQTTNGDGVGGIATISMKRHPSDDGYGQTILPNSASTHSPSPPPLLKNGGGYYSQSSAVSSQFSSLLNGGNSSSVASAGMKRNHDNAFGANTGTPITINLSNNNSMASLPSSTNSPSPPPMFTTTNGHHNGMLTNGGNIASPVSSSFSDFGSTGKEDMSPSNSVNGCLGIDCLGGDPKKKKGPAPRQQEELCLVCGDRASGYHYNALTCEGCKGFFRRSITKNAVYQCKYGKNCEIDMYMRRKCQECRLKKCLMVGMRQECVVPEYQCAIKREAKRAIKDKDKPNSTTKEGLSPNTPQMIVEEKPPATPFTPNNWNSSNGNDVEVTKKLSENQIEIIKKLVFYQDEFESPSEEEIKKIAPFSMGESDEDQQKRFQHVTEMTILTVQLIVEFSKRVPFFDTLFREDQITLLKACSSEVMMLRCSRKYDIHTDSIVYANNQPYTRDNYSSASISYTTEALFNFCRRMHMLKVDNAEYALLTAIVIFSDRPHLMEPEKVEKVQERYIETLRAYAENHHRPPNKCHFAKLLSILTELRTLGNINSELCVSLKFQNKTLPPFLAEIWDIQS